MHSHRARRMMQSLATAPNVNNVHEVPRVRSYRRRATCAPDTRRRRRPGRVVAQPLPCRAAGSSNDKNKNKNILLRAGTASDLATIQKAIFAERMNPLGVDPTRFVVAVEGEEVVGFGQGACFRSLPPFGKNKKTRWCAHRVTKWCQLQL